jgi:hypothetical protein
MYTYDWLAENAAVLHRLTDVRVANNIIALWNLQLDLRVVAISIVHYQVYIYLGHQVSNATMHYRFCQVGMD